MNQKQGSYFKKLVGLVIRNIRACHILLQSHVESIKLLGIFLHVILVHLQFRGSFNLILSQY